MARATYLADTSAFTRFTRPAVVAAVAPLIAAGQVAVCRPVMFELGFSARNQVDHDMIVDGLEAYECVPVTDGDHRRALEVQGLLAARGQHRALSLVDALVAAAAESRGLSVLHYDADFETVALMTGQPHRWIVPAGTAD